MSLLKCIIKESIGDKLKNIISSLEESLNIDLIPYDYPDVEYLGEGSFASVYSVKGTNKVIRFSHKLYSGYDKQIEKLVGKDFKHVVKIYLHKTINDSHQITVMEELELLDSYKEYRLIAIQQEYHDGLYWFVKHDIFNDEEEMREIFTDKQIEYLSDMGEVLDQIAIGLRELENNGIRHKDLRWENIMEDEKGNIKIIDIF